MPDQLLFPQFKSKQSLTVNVETQLLEETRKEVKRLNITLREAVEFGLKAFLEKSKEQKK